MRKAKSWPETDIRRASVNSFGFGGSNTHVVVDDAFGYLTSNKIAAYDSSSLEKQAHSNGYHKEKDIPYILPWSASDKNALMRMTAEFSEHLRNGVNDKYLHELAYTLSCRRNVFAWRSFAIIDSVDDVMHVEKFLSNPVRADREPGAVFIFTGQGAQYQHMGMQLLDYAGFRESIKCFDDHLQELGCSWSVFGMCELCPLISKCSR